MFMATIPNEVLELVLQRVRNDSNQCFSAALRVCRQWRDVGRLIRWRHVYLDVDNVKTFLQTVDYLSRRPGSPVDFILSITLRRTKKGKGSHVRGHQIIPWLANLLPRMSRLHSVSWTGFSFRKYSGWTYRHLSLCDKMNSLINAIGLCPRIENLEIDTTYVLAERCNDSNHLCVSIARLLPQLARLRIHNSNFCPELLESLQINCPKLQEAIIDTALNRLVSDCRRRPAVVTQTDCEQVLDRLVAAARSRMRLMPKLTHFTILGMRVFYRHQNNVTQHNTVGQAVHIDSLTFSCRYRIDMIKQETTVYPLSPAKPGGPQPVSPPFSYLDQGAWMLYEEPTSGRRYSLIADREDNFDIVFESRNWRQATTNVRLPPILAQRYDGLYWWSPIWLRGSMDWRFQFERQFGQMNSRLWYWEARLGQPLLRVRVFAGTRLPGYPVRCQRFDELQVRWYSNLGLYLGSLPF